MQVVVMQPQLMRNVLEHIRYLRQTQFRTKEVVVHLPQLGVGEVVPSVSSASSL